jgi:hypothetical protein
MAMTQYEAFDRYSNENIDQLLDRFDSLKKLSTLPPAASLFFSEICCPELFTDQPTSE